MKIETNEKVRLIDLESDNNLLNSITAFVVILTGAFLTATLFYLLGN